MTIRVYDDRIEIGTKTITATPTGISIDGKFSARETQGIRGFQGEVSGYSSGGYFAPGGGRNTIDKFPFAVDTNATDVGDLTAGAYGSTGNSSYTHGYSSVRTYSNTIERFPFATDTNAVVSQNSLISNLGYAGSNSSDVSGYIHGGFQSPPDIRRNDIQKFSFSSNTNGTDVGDLSVAALSPSGTPSTSHGYVTGLNVSGPPSYTNKIEKFPFATDTNTTDVGDLAQATHRGSGGTGSSSTTHGYHIGNIESPTNTINIQKWPFAADTNASVVGDLAVARNQDAGTSSTQSGYSAGGATPSPPATVNNIEKFSFTTDSNATDVGDLTQARRLVSGQQN